MHCSPSVATLDLGLSFKLLSFNDNNNNKKANKNYKVEESLRVREGIGEGKAVL